MRRVLLIATMAAVMLAVAGTPIYRSWLSKESREALLKFKYGWRAQNLLGGEEEEEKEKEARPNTWFFDQRAYPFDSISNQKYQEAVTSAKMMQADAAKSRSNYSASVWQQVGPKNIPGRITDIAAVVGNPAVVYAGSAAGGVFKSTDYGVTWTQVFDAVGTYSIGSIAIRPDNANVVFVGTGEGNPAGDTYDGTGIYKSTDAGATWAYSGLPESYRIPRIVIDPDNPDRIYAAVQGNGRGGGIVAERGVYRSTDNGGTWEKKLYLTDSTGCVDIVVVPGTQVVMAAMWERKSYVTVPSLLGGITSYVYRSTDRGETWAQATSGLPTPAATIGRIGLTHDPVLNITYALFNDNQGIFIGLYRSANAGASWTQVNDGVLVSAPLNASWYGGWYFGQVRCAPGNGDIVYALGLDIWRSTNGGSSWLTASANVHVDQHAMWIDPNNANRVYAGCDGGVYYSTDGGTNWLSRNTMTNTQFYAVTQDAQNANRFYGGTQDNGTMRRASTAIDQWERILGGDGFYCAVDPTDSNIIYAEYQYGSLCKSTNFGAGFGSALSGIDYSNLRHNWNTPVVMDPSNHAVLFYGSNKVHVTVNGANSWATLSPDLTNGPYPKASFGTVTTIAPAPTDNHVIYVGTDDANVWVTQTGSNPWTSIKAGLPNRWVTRVAVDWYHKNIAYVTLSGFQYVDPAAHVFRTTDFGANWTSISGNLPDAPVNDIIPEPKDSQTLYIATDYGVYFTTDLGTSWQPLGTGMPIIVVDDISFDSRSRKLVAGTHGRSIFAVALPCPDTTDPDVDGIGAACDNCPLAYNPDQADLDNDGIGDACDPCVDPDNDGYGNPGYPATTCQIDNCPGDYNPDQLDSDHDGMGDACEFSAVQTYDTIATACVNLVMSSMGGAGKQGQSAVTMDYYSQGDCEPIYMYDGTPILCYDSSGTTVARWNMYGNNGFVQPYSGNPTIPVTDHGDYLYYRSGTFVTKDQTLALEKTWYAPKFLDSCQFMIERLKVYSWNGVAHNGITIGEAIDWDVPGTNGSVNTGGADASQKLIYQQGTSWGCIDNTRRFSGLSFIGTSPNDTAAIDTTKAPYGAYTQDNVVYLWPQQGFVASEVCNLMSQPGYSFLSTPTDQHSTMIFYNNHNFAANDTLYIYYCVTTVRDGTVDDVKLNARKARLWFAHHVRKATSGAICGDANGNKSVDISDVVYLLGYVFVGVPVPNPVSAGDVDCNSIVNVSDIVYLISYIFTGGPAPCANCK